MAMCLLLYSSIVLQSSISDSSYKGRALNRLTFKNLNPFCRVVIHKIILRMFRKNQLVDRRAGIFSIPVFPSFSSTLPTGYQQLKMMMEGVMNGFGVL